MKIVNRLIQVVTVVNICIRANLNEPTEIRTIF
jgi:hypothetical protein